MRIWRNAVLCLPDCSGLLPFFFPLFLRWRRGNLTSLTLYLSLDPTGILPAFPFRRQMYGFFEVRTLSRKQPPITTKLVIWNDTFWLAKANCRVLTLDSVLRTPNGVIRTEHGRLLLSTIISFLFEYLSFIFPVCGISPVQ